MLPTSPIRTREDRLRKANTARRRDRKAREEAAEAEKAEARRQTCQSILQILRDTDTPFGDLLEFISDPAHQQGRERYWGLFADTARVHRILNLWVSSENSTTGREAVHEWAVGYVSRIVAREGRRATKDGFLRTQERTVDQDFALGFRLANLKDKLDEQCPTVVQVLESFSSTARQRRKSSRNWQTRQQNYLTNSLLIGLGARSQKNNYARHVFGLYAYASGSQRQMIELLSHLGVCSSYSTITANMKDGMLDTHALTSTTSDTSLPVPPIQEATVALLNLNESSSDSDPDSSESDLPAATWTTTPRMQRHAPERAESESTSNAALPLAQEEWEDDPQPTDTARTRHEPVLQEDLDSPAACQPNPNHLGTTDTDEEAIKQGPLPSTQPLGSPVEESAPPANGGFSDPNEDSDAMWAMFDEVVGDADLNEAPRYSGEQTNADAELRGRLNDLRTETQQGQGRQHAEKKHVVIGLLKRLSDACRHAARVKASTRILAFVYDNINMFFRLAEPTIGDKSTLQNGTCATAFELFDAHPDDMLASDYIASLTHAPNLSRNDILMTHSENRAFTDLLQRTVLSIIINYGGPGFSRFRKQVEDMAPGAYDQRIPLHRTEIFPLPTMKIDESTIIGNAEVTETIFSEVGLEMGSDDFQETVKLIAGDQLSIARLRALARNRAGHDSFSNSYLWAVVIPGIFHYKMAATHGFMELFYGSNPSPRNPGSLAFHNNVLDRTPITITSMPPFRESRNLIFISLYARVLHCLELVSRCEDLADYAANVTFEVLKFHAGEIVAQFTDGKRVDRMRTARAAELRSMGPDNQRAEAMRSASRSGGNTTISEAQGAAQHQSDADIPNLSSRQLTEGDMVFENAILLFRDALILRLLTDTVKCGDSGRLVLVFKILALYYRGCGRTKYAQEVLFVLHNITHVWPEPLRNVVLQNWLVNPTGKPNAWVEVDLMQEHFNFWIKTIYKAHGPAASWEWLAMISPCIDILRRLATEINTTLGAKQGTKHTTPNLERDIGYLMASLRRYEVYQYNPGREIDDGSDSNPVVADSLTIGLQRLSEPLGEFNTSLAKLKQRCKAIPLIGGAYAHVHGASDDSEEGVSATHVRPPVDTALAGVDHRGGANATHVQPPGDAAAGRDPLNAANVQPQPNGGDPEGGLREDESEEESGDEDDDLEPQALMSLETAEDVALDMDAADFVYEDE
ncbi:hypothetical protein EVJ58_g10739 [Rhodofomes roseus]|uniref:DUF6589 domain-containing protein n=1 Tax=Rhodofomes roseus TaxID=34475 RepID=A0A4Y9XPF2_9APHY|nr:hypothetical protein EVJ58_g10739 [Rhodofomes roseus]